MKRIRKDEINEIEGMDRMDGTDSPNDHNGLDGCDDEHGDTGVKTLSYAASDNKAGGVRLGDAGGNLEDLDECVKEPDEIVPFGAECVRDAGQSEREPAGAEAADEMETATPPKTASKKVIKVPKLVSMWKYMLNRDYSDGRLRLYRFLNDCLRDGRLAEVVGQTIYTRIINRDVCDLKDVTFWDISGEEFFADIQVELGLQTRHGNIRWRGYIVCICAFLSDGFHMWTEELTNHLDREAEGYNMLSPFLVPYYTNAKMDMVTEKLWKDVDMPYAIGNPSYENAVELSRKLGLEIMYADIFDHKNVDSILFFEESDLVVGVDRKIYEGGCVKEFITDEPTTIKVPAQTIVINSNRLQPRFSCFHILHECIHYYYHYKFYRLQKMASNDPRFVDYIEVEVDKQTKDGKTLKNPIYFMEMQANRGAYGLLMPKMYTRKCIEAECKRIVDYRNKGEKYEKVGKKLSHRLGLPHFRVRARMIQLGYIEARGSLNYVDRKLIRPFGFDPDAWRESEVTYVINRNTVNKLYRENADFRSIINSGNYIYADGHVVRNLPRFVYYDGNRYLLTDEAANRINDCCLRFTRQYVQKNVGEYIPGRLFFDPHYVEQTQFYLSDIMNKQQIDVFDAKRQYVKEFPDDFEKAFDKVRKQNHLTREAVAEMLNISTPTLRALLSGQKGRNVADFIIMVSQKMFIPDWISSLLLERGGVQLSEYIQRDRMLNEIRTVYWDQGIDVANNLLRSKGEEMLTVLRSTL